VEGKGSSEGDYRTRGGGGEQIITTERKGGEIISSGGGTHRRNKLHLRKPDWEIRGQKKKPQHCLGGKKHLYKPGLGRGGSDFRKKD